MKKIWLFLMFLILAVTIISCAAYEDIPYEISIYDQLEYDTNSLSFTNIDPSDLLYQVGNVYDDFIILHQEVLNQPLDESKQTAYLHLLNNVEALSILSDLSIKVIISYTSSELKNAFEQYDLDVTLDDIVTFNEIKSILLDLESTDEKALFIRKIDYINFMNNMTLTTEKINHLQFLQEKYSELKSYDHTFDIKSNTFEDFLSVMENMSYSFTEIEIENLNQAYLIIKNLIDS